MGRLWIDRAGLGEGGAGEVDRAACPIRWAQAAELHNMHMRKVYEVDWIQQDRLHFQDRLH